VTSPIVRCSRTGDDSPSAIAVRPPLRIAALASETHAAIDARRYDAAINHLQGIKKLMAT
jgi:hypothetical protein